MSQVKTMHFFPLGIGPTKNVSFFCVYKDCTGLMVGIEEDSVRYAHSGPSQRFLRGLRPLVSVGPLPLPVSAGGHASSIPTINPPELYHMKYETDPFGSASFLWFCSPLR